MEVEEFIKSTLRQIINGVNAIDGEGISNHDVYLDQNEGVKFDLAVTAETTGSTGGKAGVKIHIVEAGVDKKKELKESTASRIQFKVFP